VRDAKEAVEFLYPYSKVVCQFPEGFLRLLSLRDISNRAEMSDELPVFTEERERAARYDPDLTIRSLKAELVGEFLGLRRYVLPMTRYAPAVIFVQGFKPPVPGRPVACDAGQSTPALVHVHAATGCVRPDDPDRNHLYQRIQLIFQSPPFSHGFSDLGQPNVRASRLSHAHGSGCGIQEGSALEYC
jgi:hypothetical protein